MIKHTAVQHLEPCHTRYRVFTRYRVTQRHDIGSCDPISGFTFDPISGHVVCRPISVPISGTHPISGHHGTDIVNHIPDIGINIGINIGCPDIGDMLSRYRCQYRVPISGVPISGYDSHRCRSQYRTRYRIRVRSAATACTLFLTNDLHNRQWLFEAAIRLSRSFKNARTSA